jgi:chromosome partitioning protein
MKVVSFASIKGGVGKSTNAIMTANNLAARNQKVLYIDLDDNNSGSLYYTMGVENIETITAQKNTFEALGHHNVIDYSVPTIKKNVDIILSSPDIANLRSLSYRTLAGMLDKPAVQEKYQYCIIDTSPKWDNFLVNAFIASDAVLTPLIFDNFNYTTLSFIKRQILNEIPEQLDKWWIFYARWNNRIAPFANSEQSKYAALFEATYRDRILDIHIPVTTVAWQYINKYTTVSTSANGTSGRLAKEVNHMVDMFCGENTDAPEIF